MLEQPTRSTKTKAPIFRTVTLFKVVNPTESISKIEVWRNDEHINGLELAQQRLKELQNIYLQQEIDRFAVSIVTMTNDGEVWSKANLETDSEIADYRVFNQVTGLYESVATLTEAKALVQSHKDNFLNSINMADVIVVEMQEAIE